MSRISRRDFLKGIAAGTLSAAGMSVLNAVAPAALADEAPASTQITETLYSTAAWRIKPEAVAASEIAEVLEADVCVVGLGHAGATCATQVAQSGKTVIGIETQNEESYRTTGNDFGHINSKLSESLGGGSNYDAVQFMNNWMLCANNAANPRLAMKFAQNCGEAIDWWNDMAEGETTPKLVFEGANEERPHIQTEAGPYHFYCSAVNFNDTYSVKHAYEKIKAMNDANAFLFGYSGSYLLQDDNGAVTGVIAKNEETGAYVQVNAKAVVVCTGGFGGNEEMCNDLLVDLKGALQPNDSFRLMGSMGFGRDGSGIKMLYWAGANLESNPATMDGRASWQTSNPARVPMLSHPQGIHLDYTGRRFYNEYWGPIELRSRPLMTRNRDIFYCVFDSKLTEYMQYVPASHGTTNPTAEKLQSVRDVQAAAYAVKGTGYYDESSKSTWYAGDTVEEAVAAAVADEKVAANIVKSVANWNEMCAAGADIECGREEKYLFPIEEGPFYVEINENNVVLGNFLVTLGGVYVDGDQRVLGKDWMPISGLFASGNTTGGRFGWDYFSPSYGVSVGMAATLGRECGKSVVEYLDGELI